VQKNRSSRTHTLTRRLVDVPNDKAIELLNQYRREVQLIARTYSRIYPNYTSDDLEPIGNLAVLEGYKTYQDHRGCTEATWIKKVIAWRIKEEAQRYSDPVLDEPDRTYGLRNGMTPAEQYETAYSCEAIGILDPREAVILKGQLEGYSCAELAAQLGVSHNVVWRSMNRAIRQLTEWADQDDID
jgi:RNA polymerase sigma factor (sigma-70 family)